MYLAVEAPKIFRREHLAGLLWSDNSEEQALHNLRQTLYKLKKTWSGITDKLPLLCNVQDTITLNPGLAIWVDVLSFEKAFSKALKYYNDPKRLDTLNIQQLLHALDLFKAPFLDRFHLIDTPLFSEWVSLLRERMNQQAVKGLNLLIEYHLHRGEYIRACHLADRVIELNPWDESAYARSMRLYSSCRQWETANSRYYQLKRYLKEYFSVDPDPSITELYQEIQTNALQGETTKHFSPPKASSIPNVSTSFIGREDEISELVDLIVNPEIKQITIIGRGGLGKTRLAIEIGRLLNGLYADGTFFVPIKGVSSSDNLYHKIGISLLYIFSEEKAQREQLVDYLREKQMLLILDGCEGDATLPYLCDLIRDLLHIAPGLTILATSQKRLGLDHEYAYTLGGLKYHQRESEFGEMGGQSDAIALFKERVLQIDRQIVLSKGDITLLSDLCHQIEGHPLTIELLASAIMSRSIQEIHSDFVENTSSLNIILSNASVENKSLFVVLERAWQSLSEEHQDVLGHMVSFTGGFSEDAVLAIAGISKDDVDTLVRKSFLFRIDTNRYDIHEMIHQFLLQRAIEKKLVEKSEASHARYYRNLLEGIAEDYKKGKQIEALEAVELDLRNFQQYWQYSLEQKATNQLGKCIDVMFQFYNVRSYFNEGILFFKKSIQSSHYLDPFDPILGAFTNRLGHLSLRVHQNEAAFQLYNRALAIFEANKDLNELGLTYLGLGNYYLRTKDYEQATHFANLAEGCFTNLDDNLHQGKVLFLKGMIYQRSADYPTAKQMLVEALSFSRETSDQRGIIMALNQLAGHACNEGDYKTAESYYLESLNLSRKLKDRFQQGMILNNLASIYHPRKAYQLEEDVLIQSLEICKEIGDQDGKAIALSNLGELAVTQGDFNKAVIYANEALNIVLDLGEEWTIVVVYDILGCAYYGLHVYDTATQCFHRAVQIAYKIQAWDLLTRCLVNYSGVLIAEGKNEQAKIILSTALAHPSILYEYHQKAEDLYEKLGGSRTDGQSFVSMAVVLNHCFGIDASH